MACSGAYWCSVPEGPTSLDRLPHYGSHQGEAQGPPGPVQAMAVLRDAKAPREGRGASSALTALLPQVKRASDPQGRGTPQKEVTVRGGAVGAGESADRAANTHTSGEGVGSLTRLWGWTAKVRKQERHKQVSQVWWKASPRDGHRNNTLDATSYTWPLWKTQPSTRSSQGPFLPVYSQGRQTGPRRMKKGCRSSYTNYPQLPSVRFSADAARPRPRPRKTVSRLEGPGYWGQTRQSCVCSS